MAWLARRNINLMGEQFNAGDFVPAETVDRIAPQRLQVMKRVGVLLEGTPAQIDDLLGRSQPKTIDDAEGTLCPVCGEGPYKQLSQHVTKMHPDEES